MFDFISSVESASINEETEKGKVWDRNNANMHTTSRVYLSYAELGWAEWDENPSCTFKLKFVRFYIFH